MSGGWVGFDLDGTLAVHGEWKGINHFGAPIQANIDRLKLLIAKGYTCKIMTARVCRTGSDEAELATRAIQNWLAKQGLPRLEVTCVKDYAMMYLVDDRAVAVESNTGRVLGGPKYALSDFDLDCVDIGVPETSIQASLILPAKLVTEPTT